MFHQKGSITPPPPSRGVRLILNKAPTTVDDGKSADIFYLDFPTSNLKAKGLDKVVVKSINAWLTGRKQRVNFNGTLSVRVEWTQE